MNLHFRNARLIDPEAMTDAPGTLTVEDGIIVAQGAEAPEGSRARDEKGGADMISRYMNDETLTRVQKLKPIADEVGLSMAQLAVAWTLQNPNVSAAIVGASRPEQLVENVKASGVVLEQDVLAAIDTALEGVIERDPALTRSPATRPA